MGTNLSLQKGNF